MELASVNNENLKVPSASEVAYEANPLSILRTEGITVLPSENATSAISEASTTFLNLPILQDGSVGGIDTQQSFIIASSADGNTILVDASQIALLSEQSLPLYDGSTLFQLASQTTVDSSTGGLVTKEVAKLPEKTVTTPEINVSHEKERYLVENDEILPPDRPGQYACDLCGIEYDLARQLLRHFWKVHSEEKPHRCKECGISFNVLTNLLLHEATHCKSDPTCPVCHKKFKRLASLKSHLLLHEAEENVACTECGEEFSTQFKLDKHLQEHIAEQRMDQTFVCRTCSKGFKKLSFLREHMKIHHKLKASLHRRHYKRNIDRSAFSHKCFFCGKTFQKPSQLIRHNRIHTGERPYKCNSCDRAFNQKGALLIHRIKHTGERPYVCEFCPAAFAQRGNLRNHIRRVHTLMNEEATEGVHKCALCTCVFKKLGSLNAHMSRAHAGCPGTLEFDTEPSKDKENLHTEEVSNVNQPMVVSKDNRTGLQKENSEKFAVESNLNDILQQALENSGLVSEQSLKSKPSIMTVADSATGVVRRHIMRSVGGVKWYQCVYCSKEFKKPSDLVRHIRIHTHEKPYKCVLCYRAFAVKSTLSAHIRTHTGTKDYSCEHCKKLFSTSGSLKVHLLLHSGARPFACTLCDKTFRTSGHRKCHMASHLKTKTPRRSVKNASVNDINVADIPLQEPILITDEGFIQPVSKNTAMYNQLVEDQFSSDRPYHCEICHKGFKKSSHLKQHIRSHTGEKPYKCFQCDRSFVSNGVLKAHSRTHTGIKAYNCHVCSASFTTNGSLKRHMCVHSNDRPYMCPYCQKTFKTSLNCKKHMNTHRCEIVMGLASGVAVTVISENSEGNVKDVSSNNNESIAIETAQNHVVPSDTMEPVITVSEAFPSNTLSTDGHTDEELQQLPQLSQEVFNTQTGMIEQAEIITHTQVFGGTQNNLFPLSVADFPDDHLTLQPDTLHEEYVTTDTGVPETISTENIQCVIEPEEYLDGEKSEMTKSKQKKGPKTFKKPFKCEQCLKVFKKSSHLKQHIITHTGEKKFRCSKCGDMFGHSKDLAEHMKAKHDGIRNFKCSFCNAEFAVKRALLCHTIIHNAENPFHCAYCSEKFSTRDLYKQHLMDYHPNTLSTQESLNESLSNQVPEMTLEETLEDTLNSANVSSTMLMYPTSERAKADTEFLPRHAHLCSQCSKSFKKPSDLIRHMRIHTGEKPYKCDRCGKAFTVKSTLDSHLKTHTGEKNFTCHVCMNLFATKGSLKVHQRLHTGVKPFKCPHCDLLFRTSGHRKSHLAQHFKDTSPRKQKRGKNAQEHKVEPVVSFPEDVVTVTQSDMQVPGSNQATIHLQHPNVVNSNIQLTTFDPSLVSKTIQIDATLLQQLQQHFNLNITINPSPSENINNKNLGDANPTILSMDGSTSGTYSFNPNMIIHQLGYAVNPQQQLDNHPQENITFVIPDSLTKNGNDEYQTAELFDSNVISFDSNSGKESDLMDSSRTIAQEMSVTPQIVSMPEVTSVLVYRCQFCEKEFKTGAQLNRHEKTHRPKPKDIYHCETCNKDFKKKNQFFKHLQSHR